MEISPRRRNPDDKGFKKSKRGVYNTGGSHARLKNVPHPFNPNIYN